MRYLWAFILLVGCVSPSPSKIYVANPLVKKILSPRIGYKTLTNTSQNPDGSIKVEEFDLNDAEVRRNLKELGFRCDVAGKMYFICQNGPGLCRREEDVVTGWGPFKKHHEQYAASIDIKERYEFLLQAKTRCESSRVEVVP